MTEEKVTAEVAESEFIGLCEEWDLDYDNPDFTEDEQTSYNELKRSIVRCIQIGRITIEGETLKYTLKYPKSNENAITELIFRIPTGADRNKLDAYKNNENQKAMKSYIGSMTGQNPKIIALLDERDGKLVEVVAKLFLGL